MSTYIFQQPTEIPVPGVTFSGTTEGTQQRDIEILFSTHRLLQKGGTVAKVGAGSIIASGTVLGRVTATGKYVAYDHTASDGSQAAVCILRSHVDTTKGDALGVLVFGGDLKLDQLTGLDSFAVTALAAREDAVTNQFIF